MKRKIRDLHVLDGPDVDTDTDLEGVTNVDVYPSPTEKADSGIQALTRSDLWELRVGEAVLDRNKIYAIHLLD